MLEKITLWAIRLDLEGTAPRFARGLVTTFFTIWQAVRGEKPRGFIWIEGTSFQGRLTPPFELAIFFEEPHMACFSRSGALPCDLPLVHGFRDGTLESSIL